MSRLQSAREEVESPHAPHGGFSLASAVPRARVAVLEHGAEARDIGQNELRKTIRVLALRLKVATHRAISLTVVG